MRFRRLASTTAIVAVAVTTLACEGRTARGFLTTGPTAGARVRLINALTSTSALDFVVDGQVAVSGVGFGSASQYVTVTLASHRLQARNPTTGTPLLDFTRDLSAEGAYSLIPAPGLSQFGALFLEDNTTPVSGQVRIRVVNVAAAPGPIAVYLTAANGDITSTSPSIPTVLFGTASDYLQVAPGSYRVRVTRAGNSGDVLVELATLTVGAGTVRTLLVTDAPSGGFPTNLSVITD
jgi:hypothetical protein